MLPPGIGVHHRKAERVSLLSTGSVQKGITAEKFGGSDQIVQVPISIRHINQSNGSAMLGHCEKQGKLNKHQPL